MSKYAGSSSLEAIKAWANGKFMLKSAVAGGIILRLNFGSEFVGQTWTMVNQDDQTETYTGTVDSTKTTDVSVNCTSATYVITLDTIAAAGGNTVTRYLKTDKYFGIYPRGIHYVDIVPWSSGTDAQIVAMVAAADAGYLDLVTEAGWAVGDVRLVSLSAMSATGVGESHAAQAVSFVLSHAGATTGLSRVDGGDIHFQVDQLNLLANNGYMNSTNTNAGSWNGSARRAWCNNVYYNAIPSTLKAIFKQMNVTSVDSYNGAAVNVTEDYFALRAEKEIFGTRSNSNTTEAAALSQVDYYKTSANIIKYRAGSAGYWWERSPYSSNSNNFCYVYSNGNANNNNASNANGLAPFGCVIIREKSSESEIRRDTLRIISESYDTGECDRAAGHLRRRIGAAALFCACTG